MLLIFDLDGTLIDSREDLAISTNATRAHVGMQPLPTELINSYVGNGAAMLVKRALGPEAADNTVEEAISFFLQFYRNHALEHTRLYDGVSDSLEQLRKDGHALAVLTNKPSRISIDIVAALGLKETFFRVYGGDSFTEKKPDPIGITTLLSERAASPEETWMVGDSGVDIQTARNAGIRACGVAWGFQPDSFRDFPPDQLVHQPSEWPEVFRLALP